VSTAGDGHHSDNDEANTDDDGDDAYSYGIED
jgi:hypothetical protein